MKIRLTDREIIALGYDCREILDANPMRREVVKKCRTGKPLTYHESACLEGDVYEMTADGGPEAATITRLENKLAKAKTK